MQRGKRAPPPGRGGGRRRYNRSVARDDIQVTVRLFGSLRDAAGTGRVALRLLPATPVGAVWGHLPEAVRRLGLPEGVRYAVNHEWTFPGRRCGTGTRWPWCCRCRAGDRAARHPARSGRPHRRGVRSRARRHRAVRRHHPPRGGRRPVGGGAAVRGLRGTRAGRDGRRSRRRREEAFAREDRGGAPHRRGRGGRARAWSWRRRPATARQRSRPAASSSTSSRPACRSGSRRCTPTAPPRGSMAARAA